jgi:hypothetical protein
MEILHYAVTKIEPDEDFHEQTEKLFVYYQI